MPTDWPLPTLSVVVATYNRPNSLKRLLYNIADQHFLKFEDVDVCVVDDGSEPPAGERINWDVFPFSVEYVYRARHPEGWPRVYSARNIGVDRTKGEVILFLDDDLVFHPHTLWLMQFYHSMWPDIALVPHMADPAGQEYYTCPFPIRRGGEAGWVTSAGLSVGRKWKDVIGSFFDEDYDGSMGFCDRDLGIRLEKAGVDIVLANAIPMFIDDSESQGSWRDYFVLRWRRECRQDPNEDDINWQVLRHKHPKIASQ